MNQQKEELEYGRIYTFDRHFNEMTALYIGKNQNPSIRYRHTIVTRNHEAKVEVFRFEDLVIDGFRFEDYLTHGPNLSLIHRVRIKKPTKLEEEYLDSMMRRRGL